MATETSEIVDYPIVRTNDLTIEPFYRDLQRQGPFKVRLPYGEPIWLATTYHDVKTIYGDRRFGKEIGLGRDTPRMMETRIDDPSLMMNMDPPRHTRVRRLALAAFSHPRIDGMRDWIGGVVDELLDDMEKAERPVEFMTQVAWALPLKVLTAILGISDYDVPAFRAWMSDLTGHEVSMDGRIAAHQRLRAFIDQLVADRREHSTDDLLSALVHARDDDDRLTEDELFSLVLTLFLGGFETTASQIGSTVFTLMTHRDRWQELLDDPELLPAALEELWRWIPSFRHGGPMIRWASEDVELSGGVVVHAGEPVLGEHMVANRDETVFPNPSEIDFHRVDPEPHLSLAWGVHRCIGAHLAHLEIELTVQKLLQRFPTLELAVPAEDVEWSTASSLRCAEELPLTW